ncbi:NAD regulator [Breoghania sp. L-A4]|uniref:NUDIX hydrolase n=1 Tax=Breoghania sp. L-A4 TaxID=2304600 RepID=UPI000E35E5EE|nr:NAD regulator [Breoghania sp. L-A4]AXS39557.1 NAD regulator [Breoghania sp. L-A4]
MNEDTTRAIEIGLNAVIVSVLGPAPMVLVVGSGAREALPFGPFDPLRHRTFEIGLRSWVEAQTALNIGHVEQLYTFGDRGRHSQPDDARAHVVSVGYLALTRQSPESEEALTMANANWRPWYGYFPWEDWRDGRPDMLDAFILPALEQWTTAGGPGPDARRGQRRKDRLRLSFGGDGSPWDEERVLERYELLYEAGLLEEARRDGRPCVLDTPIALGHPMQFDHRRILATAISRLRGKLKYRPVVFELMPPEFTLTELQGTVEAISGRHLHKQNFRRLVETAELVEPTGAASTSTGGRPAALFRFRREILRERPAPGLRVGGR